MTETELEVLRLTLWIFGISFSVKTLVFGILAGIMARQRAETAFGMALLVHYSSIAVQAAVLATLYLQYAGVLDLSFRTRMGVYALAVLTVGWVIGSGVLLIVTWWRTGTHKPRERSPT